MAHQIRWSACEWAHAKAEAGGWLRLGLGLGLGLGLRLGLGLGLGLGLRLGLGLGLGLHPKPNPNQEAPTVVSFSEISSPMVHMARALKSSCLTSPTASLLESTSSTW